jgi:hypothetical protein
VPAERQQTGLIALNEGLEGGVVSAADEGDQALVGCEA